MDYNLSLFFTIFNLSRKNQLADLLMIIGAEYVIFLAILIIFYFVLSKQDLSKKAFLISVGALIFSFLLIWLVRLFLFIPRPFASNDIVPLIKLDSDVSFPSVHTSVASALAFSHLITKSKIGLILIFLTCWIGFSRIYVGVHFPADIIGGILVGLFGALLSTGVLKWTQKNIH